MHFEYQVGNKNHVIIPIYLSINPTLKRSICLSLYLPINRSIYQSISLSICPSASLFKGDCFFFFISLIESYIPVEMALFDSYLFVQVGTM